MNGSDAQELYAKLCDIYDDMEAADGDYAGFYVETTLADGHSFPSPTYERLVDAKERFESKKFEVMEDEAGHVTSVALIAVERKGVTLDKWEPPVVCEDCAAHLAGQRWAKEGGLARDEMTRLSEWCEKMAAAADNILVFSEEFSAAEHMAFALLDVPDDKREEERSEAAIFWEEMELVGEVPTDPEFVLAFAEGAVTQWREAHRQRPQGTEAQGESKEPPTGV